MMFHGTQMLVQSSHKHKIEQCREKCLENVPCELKLTTAMGTIAVNVLMGCFVTITDDLEGQTH